MAYLKLNNIQIVGVSAAVPSSRLFSMDWLREKNIIESSSTFESVKSTEIRERRFSRIHSGLDLAYEAANQLLYDLNWNRNEVDALISITSVPDYIMPNNACILQDRLGLDTHCYSHDIAVEASGWIYGLSAIASYMQGRGVKKAILLTGVGRMKLEDDNIDYMFGHAASATAVEFTSSSDAMCFYFGSGSDKNTSLYVNQYGMRNCRDKSHLKTKDFPGDERFNVECIMNQAAYFDFVGKGTVSAIQRLCNYFGEDLACADYLLLHQCSQSVNRRIGDQLGVPTDKIPFCANQFGNTGASSIPLTIVSRLKGNVEKPRRHFICGACGDLSLSAMSFTTQSLLVSNLVEIEE